MVNYKYHIDFVVLSRRPLPIISALMVTLSLVACGLTSGSASDSNYHYPVVILDSSKLSDRLSAMAVADLNQDGFNDFIGARTTGFKTGPAAELLLMVNDKKGRLQDQTSTIIDGPIPTFFNVRDIHVGDFNGDNSPDLFFSNHGKELATGIPSWPCEQNTLLLSQPNGKLKDVTDTHLPARADFSHGSSIADIDADGDLDIWVNNLGCGVTITSYLLRNDGAGMFTDVAGVDHPNGILPEDFRGGFWTQFIDINSDGVDDLFYTNLDDARLLMNDGSGSLTVINDSSIPDSLNRKTTQGSRVADFNNDGLDDLVLFQTDASYSPGLSLQLLINDGNNGFTDQTNNLLPPQNSTTAIGQPALWIGDINGDSFVDIMVRLYGEGFAAEDVSDFYLNDGTGKFTEMDIDQLPAIRPDFAPLDVNNDGKLDFIFPRWVDSNGPSLMLTIAK